MGFKIKIKSRITILLFTIFFNCCSYINNSIESFLSKNQLHVKFKDPNRRIYQIQSEAYWPGYSCGLYSLHNIRNKVEVALGLNSRCDIKSSCSNYFRSKNKSDNELSNWDLHYLADNILNIKNFYVIKNINRQKLSIMFERYFYNTFKNSKYKNINCHIEYKNRQVHITSYVPSRTPESQIKQFIDKFIEDKMQEKLLEFKTTLKNNNSVALNFVCEVSWEHHWVTISILKINSEPPILLFFDNLNNKYNSNSERTYFIDSLYNIYCN